MREVVFGKSSIIAERGREGKNTWIATQKTLKNNVEILIKGFQRDSYQGKNAKLNSNFRNPMP